MEEDMIKLVGRFASDDADRPDTCRPWRTDGMAYATDGRIAICLPADPSCAVWAEGTVLHAAWAGQLRRWAQEDGKEMADGRRETVPLDFAKLAAADAALADAGEDRWQCAAVILPGASRMVIGARYARLVADAHAVLGECRCACPTGRASGRDRGRHRILFAGNGYDILLMAIETDGASVCGESVADAATGTLVRRGGDDAHVTWDDLRKGGAGE